MYYLTETDPRGAMGLGGKEEIGLGATTSFIDGDRLQDRQASRGSTSIRTTGSGGGASGVLTTAGKLLFGGDAGGNFVAFDPANGNTLWHSRDRPGVERTGDLHARRPAVRARGRRATRCTRSRSYQ